MWRGQLGQHHHAEEHPCQWYGRLSDEQLRAMRLVVDTGLHNKGWSRQQAIDYMMANSSMVQSDVVSEVEVTLPAPASCRCVCCAIRSMPGCSPPTHARTCAAQARTGTLPVGGVDAQMDDGALIEPDWAPDWDGSAQPAPDYEVDQRISW